MAGGRCRGGEFNGPAGTCGVIRARHGDGGRPAHAAAPGGTAEIKRLNQIPDGAYCLFKGPGEGSRRGRVALVQLLDMADPETGQRYTVKRYESEKATSEDGT